jgi:hypothetical protein
MKAANLSKAFCRCGFKQTIEIWFYTKSPALCEVLMTAFHDVFGIVGTFWIIDWWNLLLQVAVGF